MEPRSPSKLKLSISGFAQYKWAFKVCITLLVIILLSGGIYFASSRRTVRNVVGDSYFYTVVVDCGSTGTRVNVYQWEMRSSLKLPILVQSFPNNSTNKLFLKSNCQYHCMQTEPGLDKFVGNSTGVRISLEPLIKLAEQWVPTEFHTDTPIFVLATAGLRWLAAKDAKRVLDDVEAVLRDHLFVYKKSWIRVLTGKEEAYFGWVALNYEMGNLGNSSNLSSLGLLDLGGSSLQVVMEVDYARDDEHFMLSNIGPFQHQILAFSLPAFGLNEAFERTVILLSKGQNLGDSIGEKFEVRHPCLSSDFVQNYVCYGCTRLNNTNKKTQTRQMLKRQSAPIYLVGDSNWKLCRGLARAAAMNLTYLDWPELAVVKSCKARSSSSDSGTGILNLTTGTHTTRSYHALSGFFVIHNLLNLSPEANMTNILEEGQHLCSRSWANLSSISGNHKNSERYCFSAPYMASLIQDSLCLTDKDIWFGPGDLSWTLGAALVEGEYLWLFSNETQTGKSTLRSMRVVSPPIFLFIVLACLLLIVYYSQIKLPMLGKKGPGVGISLSSYMHPKR